MVMPRKMQNKLFLYFNGIPAFLSSGCMMVGEYMQELCLEGKIDYNWMVGHLSDIGLPAMATGFGMINSRNKYMEKASCIVPPILATLDELKILNLDPTTKTYDLQDIACFFVGSLMVYGLSKAKEKEIFQKMFRKKSLEAMAEKGEAEVR